MLRRRFAVRPLLRKRTIAAPALHSIEIINGSCRVVALLSPMMVLSPVVAPISTPTRITITEVFSVVAVLVDVVALAVLLLPILIMPAVRTMLVNIPFLTILGARTSTPLLKRALCPRTAPPSEIALAHDRR